MNISDYIDYGCEESGITLNSKFLEEAAYQDPYEKTLASLKANLTRKTSSELKFLLNKAIEVTEDIYTSSIIARRILQDMQCPNLITPNLDLSTQMNSNLNLSPSKRIIAKKFDSLAINGHSICTPILQQFGELLVLLEDERKSSKHDYDTDLNGAHVLGAAVINDNYLSLIQLRDAGIDVYMIAHNALFLVGCGYYGLKPLTQYNSHQTAKIGRTLVALLNSPANILFAVADIIEPFIEAMKTSKGEKPFDFIGEHTAYCLNLYQYICYVTVCTAFMTKYMDGIMFSHKSALNIRSAV